MRTTESGETRFDFFWRQVAEKLGGLAIGFTIAIVVFAIAFHLWSGCPKWLEASVMAVLSSAFAACLVGLVFQYGELDKRIGKEAVDTVLSTLFDPERKLYQYPDTGDLLKLGSTAVALANGVGDDDARRGLVEAHMNELSVRLARPQHSLDVHRAMKFDPRYPTAMCVTETMTASYVNNGNEAFENILVWRSVSTMQLRGDGAQLPKDVDVMTVTTSIHNPEGSFVGEHANSHFEQYTVESQMVNGRRSWVNPKSTSFVVPKKTSDFKVTVSRNFWLPIEDTCVRYTWPDPISGLNLTVECHGFQAEFSAKVVDCYKCKKGSSCSSCDQGVFHEHFVSSGGTAGLESWTGSQSKFVLEWQILEAGGVDADKDCAV